MSHIKDIVFHLVDDNDIDIAVNTKLLQLSELSQHIHAYNSAERFLTEIASNPEKFTSSENVVLLDIMMPNIDGFQCLDKLTALEDNLKSHFTVFMLSSSIDRNDIRRAESFDLVQKVLEKPLDIYLLKKALENIFEF